MKTSSSWMFIALASTIAGASVLVGCETQPRVTRAKPLYMGFSEVAVVPATKAAAPAPAPKAAPDRTETTFVKKGLTFDGTELFYPTGDRATSTILLRMTAPAEMRVGQEYDYTIDVVNLTRGDLQNVEVHSEHFSNLTYLSSTPASTKIGADDIAWLIGDLPAGATKQIKLKAKANAIGTASNCLTVKYANVLCIATNVVAPALQLTKTATPEICGTCDEIKLTYEAKNSGTGVAEKVMIKDTLPAGLTTVDGKAVVEIAAGDIGAGQSKPFTVMAKAAKSGTFASAASASAYPELSATSGNPSTVVKQPALTVSCDASNKIFVGRDITYKFTVKNTGDCAASGASISAPLPAGASFISADNNGAVQGGKVVWNMASLGAGQSATVTMKVKPSGMGNVPITATASATCVAAATTNCATEVAGIPAILLEVVDTDDPIEVGGSETFIVSATNQGSAQDTNVKVVLTLPAEMEFISGTGPSGVSASGQIVTMSALPTLAPKAKAEWRIIVKTKGAGDIRTKWEMTSDQFKAPPITETESTNVYK